MKWHKNMVFGEEAERKKMKIIRDIDSNRPVIGVYVVILSDSESDLMDIIPWFMLQKDNIKNKTVIGLAVTKEEAFEVCRKIIEDVFLVTGSYDVRNYYK